MQEFRGHPFSLVTILCLGFARIGDAYFEQQPVGNQEPPIERQNTGTFPKSRFEPPVERKNPNGTPRLTPEGKRQFELRIHNDNGTDTMEPMIPVTAQENLENPTMFYRDTKNAQGQLIQHDIYTLLPPDQGGMIVVVTTLYKTTPTLTATPSNSSPSPVADGAYHVGRYPVHADKDAYSRVFYHLTIIEGQLPVLVIPRVDTDLFNQRSKATYPGRVIAGALNLPDYYANIRNNFDYTVLESPKGDHWRDWMFVDPRSTITYFQLIPTHKLQKGKDGTWDVHVSKEPPPLIDIRKTK